MPEDDSLKKGQEFFQMFLKAKEFTEELLRENERLRFKLAHAETGGTDDRSRELSVAGAIAVRPEHRLVVTEGNYLLSDAEGWSDVLPLLDEAWFVEADEPVRIRRLVDRHVAHGKPSDVAERWATGSDQANADLVARTRPAADVIVHID